MAADPCTICGGRGTVPNVLAEDADFAIYQGEARCDACNGTGRGDVQRRREAELERGWADVFGTTGG
jgi:DnaJ-class molecular chaperone